MPSARPAIKKPPSPTVTTRFTSVCTSWPAPVGSDSQLTTNEEEDSAGIHPRPTPETTVHSAHVAALTATIAAVAFANRVRAEPRMRLAQTHIRKGSATTAV